MKSPIEKLLEQDVPPAPDPRARLAARRAALEEFARVHAAAGTGAAPADAPSGHSRFQGLSGVLRLSSQSQRRDVMPWYSRPMLIGGAASVCLAIVGGSLVWNTLREHPQMARADVPANIRPEAAASQPAQTPPAAEPADAEARVESAAPTPVQDERRARQAAAAPKNAPGPTARPATGEEATQEQEVVVTGTRGPLQSSLEVKREAVGVIDSISAEDAGDYPDQDSAEALQRVPGVSIAGQAKTRFGFAPPAAPQEAAPQEYVGRDKFPHFDVNPVKRAAEEPVSTFAADVDTASYSFVRRQLQAGVLPQKDAVRVEEMVNYFDYSWPAAESRAQPFKPTVVVGDSPWGKGRKLVTIGIKGYEIPPGQQPDANLVLLLDVSGSMSLPDRLPLAVKSMELLLGSLKPSDTVGIVVYAGSAGKVLDPTPVRDKQKILDALQRLQAGGSTAGAEGIKLAYQLAESSFRKGGVNRILLATDGDFNVGIDSTEELKGFVERKREQGIFLSVLGYGMGNYRDELAQALAQNGNGVAAYIDSLDEARKVLVREATGSLFTIAKDVKLQVEFNPATVAEYRLVGYETRALRREDFNNDAVDAGDIGAGHTVTAIYEITPVSSGATMIDPLRYGSDESAVRRGRPRGSSGEWGFLKIRYKLPDGRESKLLQQTIEKEMPAQNAAIRRDVRFAVAVAGFAQLLRGGTYTGDLRYDDVIEEAEGALGDDSDGYRAEFVRLVKQARGAQP
ncbi:MAG TPA: von Willebrand factor type A domain-containing protein [Steroidobacteraceae bacterium]|nr:von Willebrand factor type A domain-containing protein [Steroidobacteraceae bacterium]